MNLSRRAREAVLLNAVTLMAAIACLAPPLAQPPEFHAFADQRSWGPLGYAMDVLSNLPFALWGLAGLAVLFLTRAGTLLRGPQRHMAMLFFGGLVVTAGCSAWYHLAPTDASLVVDRQGMSVAFAGLMGLAVATRVSERLGTATGLLSLALGLLSVWVWQTSGNLTPWAVYQFGGMVLILGMLLAPALPDTLPVGWLAVLLVYGAAKLLETGDHLVFDATGWISGHSLKHIVASFAAWPVIHAILRLASRTPPAPDVPTPGPALA